MNVSQLNAWLRCRWLWWKVYLDLVTPRYERAAISLGDCTHNLLAAFCVGAAPESGLANWEKQFEKIDLTDEEAEIKELVEMAAWKIFERTRKELDLGHRYEIVKDDAGKPLVEYHFRVEHPVGDYLGFQGYTDLILREMANGRKWLTDWKVRKTFQPIDAEEFSFQMAIYTKMARMLGIDTIGSMGWQLKSAAPKWPKENQPNKKTGARTLSRQAILTDWETYTDAVLAIGGDPQDYLDMKQKLSEVEWSRQTPCYWSEQAADGMWEEALRATAEIGTGYFTRTINYMNCKPCRLRDLCQADLRGGDTEFLMQTQYKRRGEENKPLPMLIEDEEDFDINDLKKD